MEAVRFDSKAEAMAYFVFEFFDFLALEFDDFFTILANDMIVVGMLRVVWVVEFVVLAEVHFPDQTALGQ